MKHVVNLLRVVRRRERLADVARGLTRWALPTSLGIAAACIVAMRRFGAHEAFLWLSALPVPVILAWAAWRPRSLRATARRIDLHYGLDDEIGAAHELMHAPPRNAGGDDPRTAAIVALLQERAEARARELDPRPVVPLDVPGPRWTDGLALALVIAAVLAPPARSEVLRPWFTPPVLETLLGARTRIGLDMALADPLRQNLRALVNADDKPAELAAAMLDILDKLEKGELERAEAFEELERLEVLLAEAEAAFEAELEEDPATLAEAMRALAEELRQHEITEEAGAALAKDEADEAEQALEQSAQNAEADGRDAQEALRKAMEDAERSLEASAAKSSETAKQLDEAERRLRREEKQKDPSDPEEHERRLQKQRERVEQLRRQHEREMAAQRRLEQLRRDARQAADRSGSQSQRKQGVERLSRGVGEASRKARQSSRMRQARDSLEEAKTFVRRAGQQGESAKRRQEQFKRFSKAAKGKQGKDGQDKGKGKSTLLIEGEIGDGTPDMMMEMNGQDGEGQGQGEGEGEGDGEGNGEGEGHGEAGGDTQQAGVSLGGDGIGEGSVDPLADPTGMRTNKKNVHVDAKQGRGVGTAQVIRESSQSGFATESYKREFTRYRNFAQSAIDNEALPPAQRRMVKRYYQLIQPRN